MSLIEFDNASFAYDDARLALRNISLSIEAGEFICLLGANGSGKSTLIRHINGLLVPTEGSVRVLGLDTAKPSGLTSIRSSVGMVFQNPDDQIVSTLVEDDVAFGPGNLKVAPDELSARVDEALEQVGLAGFRQRDVSTLSGGEKQRVAIAGALAMRPSILVLDEATALLDPGGRDAVMGICRKLNARGMTIVFVTHLAEEAAQAHRVIVLDGGSIVLDGSPEDVFAQADQIDRLALEPPFAMRMSLALRDAGMPLAPCLTTDRLEEELGALAEGEHRADAGSALRQPAAHASSEAVLSCENVSFSYPNPADGDRQALSAVTLSLEQGALLGIAGKTGSGKSTLLQLMSALETPTSGRVLYHGEPLSDKRVARKARGDIGVVFQYPERQLFAATVFDDIAFGPRNQGLSPLQVESRVHDALQLVGLRPDELSTTSPFALSAGQQRLVAIAGTLALKPRVLLMDEPTAGLDAKGRYALLEIISNLRSESAAIALVSHDVDLLAQLCDQVAILDRGLLVASGAPWETLAEAGLAEACGLRVPHALRIAHLLGIEPENRDAYTIESLLEKTASLVVAADG